MRLTSFVVWRSWASNKLRSALTILGVALGVAIVTSIHVIDHNTIESRVRALHSGHGRFDLELHSRDPGIESSVVLEKLGAVDGVGHVGAVHSGVVEMQAGERSFGHVEIHGLNGSGRQNFGHYRIEAGEDLSGEFARKGVLVSASFALANQLEVGGRLELRTPDLEPRVICREGRRVSIRKPVHERNSESVVILGVLANEGLARRNLGSVVVSSFELARQLAISGATLYQIKREAGVDVDRLRRQLSADFAVLDSRSAMLGEGADERAFRNGVKVLGCLALVLGMFVVFQTLSQSLVERLRQIGLLRCLGASRGAIASIFLFDALATALIGSVLGIGLGILLAMLLQTWEVSTLGMGRPVTVFELPVAAIAWTACLGVVFTTAGAGFPLWKARNLPAIEVLNPRGLSEDGAGQHVLRGVNLFLFVMLVLILPGAYLAMTPLVSEEGGETLVVLAQLGGMVLLFGGLLLVSPHAVRFLGALVLMPLRGLFRLPTFLVGKAIHQNTGRFSASVCGLAVVLMALVGLKSITAALADEQRQFGEIAMKNRLFIKCAPMTPAQVQPLREIAGVQKIDAFRGRVGVTFEMRGLDRPELRAYDPEDTRPVEQRSLRRRVIVSKRLARLRGFEDGGVVNVMTDEGSRAYEIVRVDDTTGFFPDERAWAVTHPSCLVQDFCVPQANIDRISVVYQSNIDRRRVLSDIRKLIPHATWAKFGTEIVEYHVRDITRDFFLFDILLWLILSLAAVGLINGMTIAAVARSREIGVLRALGMSARSLRASFLLEAVLVAILAAGLALALSLPLGYLVVTGLNRVAGLEARYVPPIDWVGWVPLIAVAVGLIAAILPGLRAVRESPASAVRYE